MTKYLKHMVSGILLASMINVSPSCVKAGEKTIANLETTKVSAPVIKEKIVLGNIWSAVSVGFCLLTHKNRQYVAYYNADRQTVVGMRDLSDDSFIQATLRSKSDQAPGRHSSSTVQGWDSHNYLTMTVDAKGYIHLAGNMHASPMTYFRSREPGDIMTMEQISPMVGPNEKHCTYPKFMTGPDAALLFHYRDGGSGNGNEIYNIYDSETGKWKRFLDTPLVDGQGKMNAYQNGPRLGPDGCYHLLWMWRDTPDAATNHDLSYARSRDLKHWENAAGDPLTLPLTIHSKGTIIDPVPPGGGIINTVHRFGFDSKNRVVVTYHKHDEHGNTQAYAARFEGKGWKIKAISDWQGRHIFKGGGSGPSTYGTRISLGTVKQHGKGKLALPFSHWKAGRGLLVFDEETFARIGVEPQEKETPRCPPSLAQVQSDFPGMRVRWREDSGTPPDDSGHYVLRWETLGPNRDRPRPKPWPENSELVLYKIARDEK